MRATRRVLTYRRRARRCRDVAAGQSEKLPCLHHDKLRIGTLWNVGISELEHVNGIKMQSQERVVGSV